MKHVINLAYDSNALPSLSLFNSAECKSVGTSWNNMKGFEYYYSDADLYGTHCYYNSHTLSSCAGAISGVRRFCPCSDGKTISALKK